VNIKNLPSRFFSRILIASVWLFLALTPASGKDASPVVVVETRRDSFVDRVEALGTLRANETLELTATVSEIVTDIDFDDGQRVEAGDILVEMTSKEEHALIEEEKSTINEAKKQYDKFSVLNVVARVRIGSGQSYAMRIWLDRKAMAARNLVVNDIENALRAENLELPAGSIESSERNFTVRVKRAFRTAAEFERLILARGSDGYLVRLGDIAHVERGTEEDRTFFRGNGEAMVGIGIIKQSTANTIDVANRSHFCRGTWAACFPSSP
jgi:multidrug efflux pump